MSAVARRVLGLGDPLAISPWIPSTSACADISMARIPSRWLQRTWGALQAAAACLVTRKPQTPHAHADLMKDLMQDGSRLVTDPVIFDMNWVPEDLVHREAAYRDLWRIHRVSLQGRAAHSAIRGPVGVGKTALAKRFTMNLVEKVKEDGDAGVTLARVHVNCRKSPTATRALIQILRGLGRTIPDRGFSKEEMLDSLGATLRSRNQHLIVVLDEIETLLQRDGGDLLYTLTRFNEDSRGPTISVIIAGIQNPFLQMDEATRSGFKETHRVELPPYGAEELFDILHGRAEHGLRPGCIEDEVLQLMADKAATAAGNARHAIELLEGAVRVAEDAEAKEVTAHHMREGQGDLLSEMPMERLQDLTQHQALFLLSLSRALRGGEPFATTGEVEDAYHVLCEEMGESPRGHTQFWTMMKDLDAMGLLQSKKSGKGQAGSTTLMTLPDVPLDVLDKQLKDLHF